MKNKALNGKQIVWLTIAWFIGISLLVLAMTDLFREPFFQRSNTFVLILIAVSSFTMAMRIVKYKNTRSQQD
jgi:hypothetical protein